MKRSIFAFLAVSTLFSCQNGNSLDHNSSEIDEVSVQYLNFGDSTFSVDEAVSAGELVANFATVEKDTLWATVAGPITQVCTTKGCWMATEIDSSNNLFVDYDYEFLLPTNSQGQDMVMTGFAYWDSTSVDQLRHFAEDRGASEEEIAAITEPVGEVMFKAKGVKIIVPNAE
ncbi:MAG: hypothetical protein RL754_242 [Bacteroidota bacterium]|jgi:hypothetical protein